jgi:hypothetical protein
MICSLKVENMKRPWEHKLTPDEELKIRHNSMKYKLFFMVAEWIAFVLSAMFFIWFTAGVFFSYNIVLICDRGSIFTWSMVYVCLYVLYSTFAREVLKYMERLPDFDNRNNETYNYYKKVRKQTIFYSLLYSITAFVAL